MTTARKGESYLLNGFSSIRHTLFLKKGMITLDEYHMQKSITDTS